MIKNIYLALFCLTIFFSKNGLANNYQHGKDHEQIYHSFTFEGEFGEAQDGREKSFDLDGWVGGDYNRLWINSEKRKYGKYEERFELQAFYSRNIAQFWDAQLGVSHDFSTDFTSNNLNYLAIGIEGLMEQSFETKVQAFLSEKGNYSARIRQEFDISITQRLITQPYFETEIFAQDVNELEEKAGISDFEFGAVTRYDLTRKFAPYFALRYNTKTFATANYAKQLGQRVNNFIVAGGIRLRF